jgi:hypothetical protein
MWNLVIVYLETVLVSVKDRSVVYAKRTTGLEIFWTYPMVILGDVALVDAHFGLCGDSAHLDAR